MSENNNINVNSLVDTMDSSTTTNSISNVKTNKRNTIKPINFKLHFLRRKNTLKFTHNSHQENSSINSKKNSIKKSKFFLSKNNSEIAGSSAKSEYILEIQNISKEFYGNIILKNINININDGEFITILGPSGSGKTTLLRIISGFEDANAGRILFNGKDIKDIPPYKRLINTIFQNYALFPHMNVFQNVAYALTIKKVDKNNIYDEVMKLLELVNMENYANRKVSELSGGQKQRIAIARALINKPKILLLDEPLSALDKALRKNMQTELKKLQRALGITFILITHDQEEALTMSDRIIILNEGVIQQTGKPIDIYNEPESKWVAKFIGDSNIIENVTMVKDYLVEFDDLEHVCTDRGFGENYPVEVVIRPEDIIIDRNKNKNSLYQGVIISNEFKGVHWEVKIKTAHRVFLVHTINNYKLNQKVYITWLPEAIHVMWKEVES